MKHSAGKLSLYIIIALAATTVIAWFYPHSETTKYRYEEGRPWNYAQLIAPFDVPIRPDSATVRQAMDSLDKAFIPAFHVHTNIADSVLEHISKKVYGSQLSTKNSNSASANLFLHSIIPVIREAYSGNVVADEYANRILSGDLTTLRIINGNTLSQIPATHISSPKMILSKIDSLGYGTLDISRLARFYEIESELEPTLVYDNERNKQLYDFEVARITAVRGVIQQGQSIIDKGAIITPQDYVNISTYEQLLEDQLSISDRSSLLMLIGQVAFIAMLLAALLLYFAFFDEEIWQSKSAIIFIFSAITAFFLIGVGLESFTTMGIYIVPFAILPILVLVFFNARSAIFTAAVLTLLCAPITSFPMEFIVLQFTAACGAVYSLRELSKRSQLLRSALLVALIYYVFYVALELMLNGSFDGFSWRMMLYLSVNAVLTSMAYILMFAVERIFGFVSVVTLVELSDINSPLLRTLSDQCPGTFQHSMSVSTLAADAVARIGGNVQLVRAGALYHDIGKLSNPAFFTENQHGVNPHDALPPERSAGIIISHVTEGLRRADKAGLPQVLKDFIAQHHGEGKAKYFYYTYCNQHPGEDVDPTPFTYPGPNPQSKEASVLMMADSVEAASRSLKEHTKEAITELVDKIIDSQIAEGLHNHSPLSFRDVTLIKEMFIRRLMTIYHSRITYPDAPKN